MTSGVHFSAILIIWIIGIIAGFYILYPDIQNSINSINNINIDDTTEILNANSANDTHLVDYTPLGVINIIKN